MKSQPLSKPQTTDPAQDLELARRAVNGDRAAQRRVGEIAHPMIRYQTERFCPRFCHDNHYRFQCTLPGVPLPQGRNLPLCEWGNASYGWMLDDLTRPERLRRFEGRDGASLGAYQFQIANSLPFYERWKDWRLGRRAHVPTYIQDLAPDAALIFHRLRQGENSALIAQRLGRLEDEVDALVQRIVVELTRRHRLHLLDPPREVSLSSLGASDKGTMGNTHQADLPWEDMAPEERENQARLRQAWGQLTAVEQFVLEAMLIEERAAEDVLAALRRLDIPLSKRVPAAQTDCQQLYYFRRKAVVRLARLSGLEEA